MIVDGTISINPGNSLRCFDWLEGIPHHTSVIIEPTPRTSGENCTKNVAVKKLWVGLCEGTHYLHGIVLAWPERSDGIATNLHENRGLNQMEKEMLFSKQGGPPGSCRIMKAHHYDIVRKDGEKLRWLEDAADLESAASRIRELTSFWPGDFQVMDQQNHQMVAFWSSSENANGSDSRNSGATDREELEFMN